MHVLIAEGAPSGLDVTSMALVEQIRTVDNIRLVKRLGYVDGATFAATNEAVLITLGLNGL